MSTPIVRAPDCPVDRVVYGDRPCEGPGTYYCDEELWGSPCRAWQTRNGGYTAPEGEELADPTTAEALARRIHDTSERLAPTFGYGNSTGAAVPWRRVPVRARRLMVAVAQELIDSCEAP